MIPVSMHDQIVAMARQRHIPRLPLDDFECPELHKHSGRDLSPRALATALVQFEFLELLEAGEALTVRQVADALPRKSRPGWHWIINQLAESGHVARQHCAADETGTRLRFALTATGRALLADLQRVADKHQPASLEH